MSTNGLSRRRLLNQGWAALAGWLLSRRIDGTPRPQGNGVRFGVRGPFKEDGLRERALLLKRLGYQGIELGPEYLDRSPQAILADLKGTGIVVSAIVGSLKLLDPDPQIRTEAVELDRQRLGMARILGASAVIEVPMFGPCRFPDQKEAPPPHQMEDHLLVEGLKQLESAVQRTGVLLLLEPLTRKRLIT